ncbi:DUF4288 domain-containing protein [uncultured Mucilaginibacter sp.]|uniref:DUF4288 domain-containing protein n=1 Tax=uncultured Mucilaginibacter sp. TaxID=797541 RepID=UPI0025E155DA|nr:DUF4288 domain-containing protein [uncultured Mucilaginibacter sp.]
MKNIYNLEDWKLNKDILNAQRFVEVKINLKYPESEQFIGFKPKERIKRINLDHQIKLNELLALNLFDKYEINGTKKRPLGVKAKIKYNSLSIINKLSYVSSIWIESVDHAVNIKKEEIATEKYFCVKMTVAIDIEGISCKKQDIEKRFVLIKAMSSDEAYEKLEKTKETYTTRYLNSDGRFVRWKIESFDDCYETDIISPKDLDEEAGVEVYSKLKSRKRKSTDVWDGAF